MGWPHVTTIEQQPSRVDLADAAGLHGHRFDSSLLKAAFAELVGTSVLGVAVLGTVTAIALGVTGRGLGALLVPIAAGTALAVLAASVGPISGAHVNPAVTVSLAAARRFPWRRVPVYVVAQLTGAFLAAGAVRWWYGPRAATIAHLGAPSVGHGTTASQVFAADMIATFVLVVVIVAVTAHVDNARLVGPFAVGAALTAAVIVSGPIGNGGVNPAVTLAPMVATGHLDDWWVYVVAPLVGGVAAVLFLKLVQDRTQNV